MSEKSERSSALQEKMTSDYSTFMREGIILAGGPAPIGAGAIKALIRRAAVVCGIKHRRAKAYFYREIPDHVIPAYEYCQMKQLVERLERLAQHNREQNEALRQLGATSVGHADDLDGGEIREDSAALSANRHAVLRTGS